MMGVVLTVLIFLPMAFALVMGILRVPLARLRLGAMLSALLVLGATLAVALAFDPHHEGMQFVRHLPWIRQYGITYYVGVDAFSLLLLLITALLMPLLYLYMWRHESEGYWYNMLLLQTGVTGAVLALDLVLFYLFWETMLLPIFVMIGRYGHAMNRTHAMKILLFTIAGSMAMLFAILYLGYAHYAAYGRWSFAYRDLGALALDPATAGWLAVGFLLAFAIKIPLVGFHTWMAPAYSSAPTPALVILSAIMAKLGIYGLWRFGYGIFGQVLHLYEPLLITLALIGMVYYAIHAVTQNDLRRMFAYSSGSHLSLIALGVLLANLYAWSGSLYLIATHALASAGIFLMIGLIHRRTGHVRIDQLGGIATVAPRFAFFFAFFALAIVGVPGTGGFVAELLIIIGAFVYHPWIGAAAALTMLAAVIFVFWMMQRTLFGTRSPDAGTFGDLTPLETVMLLPLVILLIVTGIAPSLFTPLFTPQVQAELMRAISIAGGAG